MVLSTIGNIETHICAITSGHVIAMSASKLKSISRSGLEVALFNILPKKLATRSAPFESRSPRLCNGTLADPVSSLSVLLALESNHACPAPASRKTSWKVGMFGVVGIKARKYPNDSRGIARSERGIESTGGQVRVVMRSRVRNAPAVASWTFCEGCRSPLKMIEAREKEKLDSKDRPMYSSI